MYVASEGNLLLLAVNQSLLVVNLHLVDLSVVTGLEGSSGRLQLGFID